MNRHISVLALIFSMLVSVENSTLQNVLLSKPLNSTNSKTNMKKKLNISESNNYSFNTIKQNILNDSGMNNAVAVSKPIKGKTHLLSYSKKSRFPRQIKKKFDANNQKDSYERPYKVVLDIKPENREDYYDNYDDDKYYHNRGRNIKGLVDDWNLSSEIEKNSKPITKTLCESQERKRCSIMKSAYDLDSEKIQQPQKLVSKVTDDGRKPELMCRDCKLLKPNTSPAEPKLSNIKTTRIKQINDDYFINILKQLIDKLDKSKNLKTSDNNYLPMLKSSEPNILENKRPTSNDSSEEEWILKLEKMKRNRIMDKLDSSPERTYVNGKWLKKQIAAANKKNDCKPEVNEFSAFDSKNESISSNDDTKTLNLTNTENQVPESDDVTTTIIYSLPTTSTQEIKEVSTSPLPAENEYLVASRETVKPLYLSSVPINELDAAMIDENEQLFKSTTTEVSKSNFSNAEESYTSQDESTVSSVHTTPKESTSESYNNALNAGQSLNRILEPSADVQQENDNLKKTNRSDGVENTDESAGSFEKVNDSLENNCDYNKKVIKNILSSTMISNITEIKTDTYSSPTRTKTKSHKRSDRKLTNSGAINRNFSSPVKIVEENRAKVNALPAVSSTLVIDGDRSPDKIAKNERNAKPLLKQLSSSFAAKGASLKPETLKFENLKNNNPEDNRNFHTGDHAKSKTENSRRVNYSTRFVAKLKPVVQKTDFKEHDKNDGLNTNKKVFTVSKTSGGQTSRKAITAARTTSPRSVQDVTRGENMAKNTPTRVVTARLKHDLPKNSRTRAGKNVGEKTVIVDNTYATSKKPFSAAVKSFSRSPIKTAVRTPPKQSFDVAKRYDEKNVKNTAVEMTGEKIDEKKKSGFRNDGKTGSRKPLQQQSVVMTEKNVDKNVLNDQQQTTSTPRGLYFARGTERNSTKADQDRRFFDAEHGPYRPEDLTPIAFDDEPAKNSAEHHGGRRPNGWLLQSPAAGGQQHRADPKPVQIVRPAPDNSYDDDDDDDDDGSYDAAPIETSDGRRATVSLTELLTGGVRLQRGECNASIPGETLQLAGALREIGGAVPVQIVQIINNGGCLGTRGRPSRNGAGRDEKSRSSSRSGGGTRVQQSPARLRNAAPAVKQLEKAYDHFDSEILNKFLRVYAPPHEV